MNSAESDGMSLLPLTVHQLREALRSGQATSIEVTRAALDRIKSLDGELRSFITVDAEGALAQAAECDRLRRSGEERPLLGVPLALKDIFCTRGLRTTCASRALENFVPAYDATVTERLRAAGAVILGKTNQDEYAMGSSTENSCFGPSHNPWDLKRTPGGSSGGSAAAVAADLCFGALGTDTGGSIRQPAAFCGIAGLNPTYGRVSRFGLVAFASSLDQAGPLTKDVRDAALLLNLIAGHDPNDSTSAQVPVPDYTLALTPDVKGIRLGVAEEFFSEGLHPEVEERVRAAIATLEGLGARSVQISLPHLEYSVATYYVLATAEASSNLARYDGVRYSRRARAADDLRSMYSLSRRESFNPETKRRIMLGTYALSAGYYDAYYLKAQKVRTLIRRDFEQAFQRADLIAAPVAPTSAFLLGEKVADPLEMYLSDIYTIPVKLAGLPAISVPCGLDSLGLPVGFHLIGRPFDEQTVLGAAFAFEQATDHHLNKPPLSSPPGSRGC